MKINLLTSTISFQKKFLTTATVLKRGRNYECNIYELDPTEDKDYFSKVYNDRAWKKSVYIKEMKEDFPENYPKEKTYTIEDTNEKCLGFINIEDCYDTIEINLLEVCPKLSYKAKRRKTKYIGQGLINFLISLAKEQEKKRITVPIVRIGAEGFYEKCGFELVNNPMEDALLTSNNFDKVLEKK